jgi:hypothetical protein
MNAFGAALKTLFNPVVNQPARTVTPTFKGAAASGSANLCVDTFNGTPLFTGSSSLAQYQTHSLGHLDTFA